MIVLHFVCFVLPKGYYSLALKQDDQQSEMIMYSGFCSLLSLWSWGGSYIRARQRRGSQDPD